MLQGLAGLHPQARSHPAKRVVFWVVALVTSPFLLMGTMLAAFGSDLGDHVAGLVMLVLFLPGLLALRRWAWPKRQQS